VVGPIPETSLISACRVLFGPDIELSREFLFYMQPSGVKAAYRQRAKESHPDATSHHDQSTQRRQLDRFREVTDAYKLICTFFSQKTAGATAKQHYGYSSAMSQAKRQPQPEPLYYRGPIPPRPLEIGRYLYYRGIIPYQALIQALGLQRRQRPSVGRIARSWGWLTGDGINNILFCQHLEGRFGDKAEHLGLLNRFQINSILHYQKTRQKKLGQYFVQMGYTTPLQMDKLVHDLHEHNTCHPYLDAGALPSLSSPKPA